MGGNKIRYFKKKMRMRNNMIFKEKFDMKLKTVFLYETVFYLYFE